MGVRPRKVECEDSCQQSCGGKEVLRPVCNGHNLDHALHGPSGDEDMLQCLYDQGNLETVGKEEVVFGSSSPWPQHELQCP